MSKKVQHFNHARKGRLVGVIVSDDGEWVQLQLVGDQTIRTVSISDFGDRADGEVITVRKDLLIEVEPSD